MNHFRITPTREHCRNNGGSYPDFYAVGYDGNWFETAEEAEEAIPGLYEVTDFEEGDLEVVFDEPDETSAYEHAARGVHPADF